jgi:hypothetical protein
MEIAQTTFEMSGRDVIGPAPVDPLIVEQFDPPSAAQAAEVPDERVVLQRFKLVGLATRRTNW